MPCQSFCSTEHFKSASRPRRVRWINAWAEVTTPPCALSNRSSSAFTPGIVGAPRLARQFTPRERAQNANRTRRVVHTHARSRSKEGGLLDDVDHHAHPDVQRALVEIEVRLVQVQ